MEQDPIINEKAPKQSKVVTASIALATAVSGFVGGQALSNTEIADLQVQVSTIISEKESITQEKDIAVQERDVARETKQAAVDLYVYSQISSGRIPTVTPDTSLNEIEQAYVNTIGNLTRLNDKDLFEAGKRVAAEKGDLICK